MGNLYSYNTNTRICDDYLGDKEFSIHIKIHSCDALNLAEVAEYLQYLKPVSCISTDKIIILRFNGAKKPILLRSDISGEIISSVVTDITKYCINNSLCDPYYVEASIYIT